MNKSYTLSLSRWHKVAERLAKNYSDLTNSAKNILTNTQVSGYLGDGQVARLQQEGALGQQNLRRAFEIQDTLVQIRKALGEANARTGVAIELAEYDALSRRQKLLQTILAGQSTGMILLEDMPQLPKQLVTEDRYDRSKTSVRVGLLDVAAQATISRESEELLSRIYALADKISDLNRERLTLDFPEQVAKIVGL